MTTKIRSIEKKTYNGKDSFTVAFEDGEKGYLSDKDSDKDLRQGEEVTYTKEVKQNSKGGNYNLFAVKRTGGQSSQSSSSAPQSFSQPGNSSNSSSGQDIKGLKVNACVSAMHDAVSAFNSERIPWEKVVASQTELAKQLCSEIDDIFSGKI